MFDLLATPGQPHCAPIYIIVFLQGMREFIITEAKSEEAVLVGLITKNQNEEQAREYLDDSRHTHRAALHPAT